MRSWPILAVTGVAVLVLCLGALWAGPSLMAMCDGSMTGIGTGDAVTLCELGIAGARYGAIAGGLLVLVALSIGILQMAAGSQRDKDARPLVSVRARRR